jgi:hypothetical protein
MSLEGKKDPFPDAGRPGSKYEDERFGGMTVAGARKKQEKDYRVKWMVKNARQKKQLGMQLAPEEQFVLDNSDLLS